MTNFRHQLHFRLIWEYHGIHLWKFPFQFFISTIFNSWLFFSSDLLENMLVICQSPFYSNDFLNFFFYAFIWPLKEIKMFSFRKNHILKTMNWLCVFLWFFNFSGLINSSVQISHLYLNPRWRMSLCSRNLSLRTARWSQSAHGYLRFSCTLSTCCLSLSFRVELKPQIAQG